MLVKNWWENQGAIHGYDFERQRFGVRKGRAPQTKGAKSTKVEGGAGRSRGSGSERGLACGGTQQY